MLSLSLSKTIHNPEAQIQLKHVCVCYNQLLGDSEFGRVYGKADGDTCNPALPQIEDLCSS